MQLTWKEAFGSKKFLAYLGIWALGIVLFVLPLPYYFNEVIQPKPGVQVMDPIHDLLVPVNWSIEILILIFGAPILFLLSNYKSPQTILLTLQCYVVISLLRMISVYLFTLEAPDGIIPLVDPFLTKVVYGNIVYVKDLFFSGHTSIMFLVFLIERKKPLKVILGISTFFVALFLIWQRVHYSIDILGAIFVTWFIHAGLSRWNNKIDFRNKVIGNK